MKFLAAVLALLFVLPATAHCQIGNLGGSLKPKQQRKRSMNKPTTEKRGNTTVTIPPSKPMTKQQVKKVDRSDAASTAEACLLAFQKEDFKTLASLSKQNTRPVFDKMTELGPKNNEYQDFVAKLSEGPLMKWNSQSDPLDVRYRKYDWADVGFHRSEEEVTVLRMKWEDNKWCLEDINTPARSTFDDLEKRRPAEVIVKAPRSEKDQNNRFDAISTAEAVLEAYQQQDLQRLASLSTAGNQDMFLELKAKGKNHPRYKSIFSGWRWEKVQDWSPKRDVSVLRYRDRNTAVVSFDLDFVAGESYVVTLEWENNQWCFEDINSPDVVDYMELPNKRPQE